MDQSEVGDGTYASKADFVAKVVEAANAVLGIFEVVVLDEAEPGMSVSKHEWKWSR
jgi:hypothetical protein